MPSPEKAKGWLSYLQKRGWMGEAGLGLIVCFGVGLALHLQADLGAIWGMPAPLFWGGSAGAGVFMLTAALRLIPSGSKAQ